MWHSGSSYLWQVCDSSITQPEANNKVNYALRQCMKSNLTEKLQSFLCTFWWNGEYSDAWKTQCDKNMRCEYLNMYTESDVSLQTCMAFAFLFCHVLSCLGHQVDRHWCPQKNSSCMTAWERPTFEFQNFPGTSWFHIWSMVKSYA